MKSIWKLCRDYPFSTLCIVVIWILCVIPIPETPLSEVSMIDKWTHLVMYGGLCTMIWTDRARLRLTCDRRGMVVYALLLPIVMGGVIELVQAYCTGGTRSGEWLDLAADSLGVLIGQPIGMLLAACHAKWRKGRAED